ncbi:MAG: hypothetical protein BAJALOKI1v1_2590006 [Promethearchaeota archaeon]|nr:MAG: hypothetical protein BAJALOKI1v1_2590006 [Candidatus Lokiarchaeota archaeon]
MREKEGNEVNCLLLARLNTFPEKWDEYIDPEEPLFKAAYVGKYSIPRKWTLTNRYKPEYCDFKHYHAIQSVEGLLLISPNVAKYSSLQKGKEYMLKTTTIDLISWKSIEGEPMIDPLIYEKMFIEKFWTLMESTRARSNNDVELQKEFIYQELLNWSYDELKLYASMINHFLLILDNRKLKTSFKKKSTFWGHFLEGIIALGRDAVREMFIHFQTFAADIQNGTYAQSPQEIELNLYSLYFEQWKQNQGFQR